MNMRKSVNKSLSVLLALVMMLALSVAPVFATVTMPTGSTLISISEVTSITIGGETAVYQQDDNGSTKFIRADLDTEYDLQSANIVINLVSSGTTVNSGTLTFTGGGTATRTASNVDLLNKAYDVTIGSTTYTLAADLPNGTVGVSSSDPLKVSSVTFTTTPNVSATVYGFSTDRYAGNPWYAQEGLEWTIVKYYAKANGQLPSGTNRSAVPGTITLAAGATASGCYSGGIFDLDQNLNVMTVSNSGESREYRVSAGVDGQVKVFYDIVLDEIENDGTYYTGVVIDQCDEINAAVEEYFDPDGFYVDSGTSVMDIMIDFTDWAENEGYFSYPSVNSGTYLADLNGLAEFDGGSLSGWMYTDQGYTPTCSVPWVGAADYLLTSEDTHIDWFYTTDYFNHF